MEQDHVMFKSEIRASGFVQLAVPIMRDSRLSDGAKMTYCSLRWYARGDRNTCFPGQDRLAKDRNISRQTLNSHLQQLIDVGLISIQKRGFGYTNLYILADEHEVYGERGNWNKYSEKARKACRLDENGQPEKPEKPVQKPKIVADDKDKHVQVVCAISDGARKAQEGKEKLKKKQEQKVKENIQQAGQQKSTTKASLTKISPKLEIHWVNGFRHIMGVPVVEKWNLKDKKFIREMTATYGEARVASAINYLFYNWDDIAKRLRIKEVPSVSIMFRIRKTLFVEAETGIVVGSKSKQAKMNEDEYDAEAASKAPKVGWT